MNEIAPEYLQSLFCQRHSAYKELWGKADPVQTKHHLLFETKLLLQRGHVMK